MSIRRREFLKTALGSAALLSLGPALPAGFAAAAKDLSKGGDRDTVLVIVELPGGNDGLNTVVPYADDDYARNRATLRLTESEVLKIDAQLGFHPQMTAMKRLWDEGRLSVIQGVGYPKPQGGHDESMRIWQSARPTEFAAAQTGWIGRAIDQAYDADALASPALYLGEGGLPFALRAGQAIVPCVSQPDALVLRDMPGMPQGKTQRFLTQAAARPGENSGSLLDFLSRGTAQACAANSKIEALAAGRYVGRGDYPRFSLAADLHKVAQWIRADCGIRLFFVEHGGGNIGGYDTHAGQRDNHAALMLQLSESIAAFTNDLAQDKLLDRVLLMTFSEFGRTLLENGRRGTDHGSAAPVFLAGGKVKGGVLGSHPSLTELENGGPKYHTDFRRVYATVLEKWLGWKSSVALSGKYEPLDVLV